MKLFQAWAESLTLFKPENIKTFLLVTLKSILETYKVLFTKFWAAFIAPFAMVATFLLGQKLLGAYRLFELIPGALWIVSLFFLFPILWYALVFLCARPSVMPKNWQYVVGYWRHCIYLCLLILIISRLTLRFSSDIFVVLDFIYILLFTAFLLDSDARFKTVGLSLLRAGKMIVYNLPFIFASTIIFVCLLQAFFYISHFFIKDSSGKGVGIGSYLTMWLLPIPVCFYINFYIKKIHEQFSLYFSVKGN